MYNTALNFPSSTRAHRHRSPNLLICQSAPLFSFPPASRPHDVARRPPRPAQERRTSGEVPNVEGRGARGACRLQDRGELRLLPFLDQETAVREPR